jgi:hypothetical protein
MKKLLICLFALLGLFGSSFAKPQSLSEAIVSTINYKNSDNLPRPMIRLQELSNEEMKNALPDYNEIEQKKLKIKGYKLLGKNFQSGKFYSGYTVNMEYGYTFIDKFIALDGQTLQSQETKRFLSNIVNAIGSSFMNGEPIYFVLLFSPIPLSMLGETALMSS